jgi:hypothetical protein
VMTPHCSAYSCESIMEQRVDGAQVVVDVLSGRWPEHLVNPSVKPWFPVVRPD